jgi:capsular polysaccharide biosynthesis protein
MADRGFPPIAEASSVRAMGRMDRMDSMEAAEEVEGAAAARGIYFVSPQILTVRGQVVVAAVRAARAAKAVEAAAAGEGRLESIFTITAPMGAL